jgi:hypothetical protein
MRPCHLAVTGAIAIGVMAGCDRSSEASDSASASAPEPPAARGPIHLAAENRNLRLMLAELAAAKACSLIEGQFRALRDPERPRIATGFIWIHGCRITRRGTKIDFGLTGFGWQWASKEQSKAGATFAVRQYVRFAIDATIPGALDVAYDPGTHVASLWFTPERAPDVRFEPVGGVDVDEEGAWSSVLGAVSSVFASSPDEKGEEQAGTEGKREFRKQFADGLSVTIDLCTGLARFGLGRPRKGAMVKADVGESAAVPVELQPGGVMTLGPYLAPRGMTVKTRVHSGEARFQIVCHKDAEAIARAFVTGNAPPTIRPLAARDVRGDATLRVRRARCPVAVVAHPLGTAPVVLDWHRPIPEAAGSTGGPLVQCGDAEPR